MSKKCIYKEETKRCVLDTRKQSPVRAKSPTKSPLRRKLGARAPPPGGRKRPIKKKLTIMKYLMQVLPPNRNDALSVDELMNNSEEHGIYSHSSYWYNTISKGINNNSIGKVVNPDEKRVIIGHKYYKL